MKDKENEFAKGNEFEVVYNYCYEDKFQIEDLERRRIFLNYEIDGNVIDGAAYNSEDKGVPVEQRKPILLYINSPGGNISDGYGLIDTIKLSTTPVYTINLADCLSMALLVFIAGHKRYAMPHSEFLLHDGATGGFDSLNKIQDRMKFESEQIESMTKKFILENTKITDKQYEMNLRKEWYFLPQEGKELGVVDFIIGEDCKLDDII